MPLQNKYSKINYKYKVRIPCVMSMNIFDPNECVNKEKCSVCMQWTKRKNISICALCTCIKINYKIFKVYNSQVKSLFTNVMRTI